MSYLRRYRGQRAGRVRRSPPTLRPAGNGAYIVSHPAVNHRPISCSISCSQRPRTLINVRSSSSADSSSDHLTFASLNIRSLANKVDDLLELRRDRSIDVLCLTETWHSADSVSLRRLRADGFQVADRPRPQTTIESLLSTNHGGVAIVSVPGARLSVINVGVDPSSFELLCARFTAGSFSCVIITIYTALALKQSLRHFLMTCQRR